MSRIFNATSCSAFRRGIRTGISKGTDLRGKVQRHKGNGVTKADKARVGAFTLIELLVVISIIAVLAGLVLAAAGSATFMSQQSRMKSEHQKLVTGIESYKATMGNFPPDNQDPATLEIHERAGRNALFYELSGCTFDSANGGTFTTQNSQQAALASQLKPALGAKGIENSARNKRDIPFKGISFKSNQYDELDGYTGVNVLIAPIKGPYSLKGKNGKMLNPWFYDASSTNRHNMESYDLWSEYTGRNKTNVIGNW